MTRSHLPRAMVLVALLASSCTLFKKPEPVIKTEYVNVPTPVKVPCLKEDQVPKEPTRLVQDQPTPPDTLTEIVGRLRAKLKQWQDGYGPTSQDLLKVCSRLPAPSAPPPQPPGG